MNEVVCVSSGGYVLALVIVFIIGVVVGLVTRWRGTSNDGA